ncbi:hypothetical protein HYX18_03160 [Candidatus Woesearchaeota archaeon]|nr:hypothetical protein [Candidatus Woesearchaeota archaeon]
MEKRGQVALFIILGIVVIVVIGFIYFNRGLLIKETAVLESNEKFVTTRLEPIKSYVQNCVYKSALNGLILLGKQGGHYNAYKAEELNGINVSYACYKADNENINQLPLISDMSNEFNEYMKNANTISEINKCIDDFKTFKKEGLNVKENGKISFSNNILENNVRIDITYPLEVSRGDYTATLKNMFAEVPVGIGKAHKIAVEITNKECNNEEFDFDSLGLNEPIATSSVQGYGGKEIIYLKTIPSFKDEIPIEFNFIIEK